MDDPPATLGTMCEGAQPIKLCVAALKIKCTPEEEMAFIDDVIDCSDKLAQIYVDTGTRFNPRLQKRS